MKKKSSNRKKCWLYKPFEPNYKEKCLYEIKTSARLFLYLEHGAKCQGSEEFESTLCSSKITFELQRERAGGWWQIQNFNAMSSRRLKNKQTSKQTIKISESSMKTVHSLVGHVRRNFETCLIPLRFGTIREQEWL